MTPVKTEPTLLHTNPALDIDVVLEAQIPVITVMGDDQGDKTTMIAATLARALNDFGKHVLYCYFDESGHFHSKHTTTDDADLIVVACPHSSASSSAKWLEMARIRLLLTFDVPFGMTHAYAEIKQADQKLAYEDLVVNTVNSYDGITVHHKLTELMHNNHVDCKLHYLGSLTLFEDITQCYKVLPFEGETANAHRQVAEQLMGLLPH